MVNTWRIIPASKWLVTPTDSPFRPFGRGITHLGDLLSMVINHLLTGMILQVWYIKIIRSQCGETPGTHPGKTFYGPKSLAQDSLAPWFG